MEGLPRWLSGKGSACQYGKCRRCGLNPWAGKTPWNRERQPTAAFLPGEPHGQRSLLGYNPLGCQESGMTERLSTHAWFPWGLFTLHWQEVLSLSTYCSCSVSQGPRIGWQRQTCPERMEEEEMLKKQRQKSLQWEAMRKECRHE